MKKLLLACLLACCSPAWAAEPPPVEIKGTVIQVAPGGVTVRIDSEYVPNPGDRVEFFLRIPGLDDRARVRAGTVAKVGGKLVLVKLGPQGPVVAKDYEAVVFSDNPRRSVRASAAPPPRRVSSGSPAPSAPNELGPQVSPQNRSSGGTAFVPDEPGVPSQAASSGGGTAFVPNEPSALPLRAFSGQGTANTPTEPGTPPPSGMTFEDPSHRSPRLLAEIEQGYRGGTQIFQGKVFDGTKAIARLSMDVGAARFMFLGGAVDVGTPSNRMSAGVELRDSGEIVIDAFPLTDGENVGPADPPRTCRATLSFDPQGKPGKDVRRLFGTVKTAQGQVYTFEARIYEPPPLPGEGQGRPPVPPPTGGPDGPGGEGPNSPNVSPE